MVISPSLEDDSAGEKLQVVTRYMEATARIVEVVPVLHPSSVEYQRAILVSREMEGLVGWLRAN